jgi:hypothetical protein
VGVEPPRRRQTFTFVLFGCNNDSLTEQGFFSNQSGLSAQMKCNAHISNGLPVGYLGRWPFWLAAVIVSFVPTRILSTIDYLIAPS